MNKQDKCVTNSIELGKDVLDFYASSYSEEELLLNIGQALKEEEYCIEVLKTRHQCGKEITAREKQRLTIVQHEVRHWQAYLKAFKAFSHYLSKLSISDESMSQNGEVSNDD